MLRKINGKWISICTAGLALAASAHAADPTTIAEVADQSTAYIGKGTTAAIAAGTLSFGWVLLVIVRRYTKRA